MTGRALEHSSAFFLIKSSIFPGFMYIILSMSFKGNPEHLKILQEALDSKNIQIWNNFHNKLLKEGKKADLGEVNLVETDLEGANLGRANLEWANLEGANLGRANLVGTNLVGARLGGARLRWANLGRASLGGADLREADLRETSLVGAELIRANLRKANLGGANLLRASLVIADLEEADLEGANLRGTLLEGATLTGVNLYHTIRNSWKINDIKCDYIYFDLKREKRFPKDRNFKSGEFEEYMNNGQTID